MPMYVYACQGCGRNFEVRQRFQDDPLTVCEVCSGQLRRVLQPVGIVFKGSGFYSTDYKSGNLATPGTVTSNGESSTASTSDAPVTTPASSPIKDPAPAGSSESPSQGTP
jgi:putative FmdB family regulatory protein